MGAHEHARSVWCGADALMRVVAATVFSPLHYARIFFDERPHPLHVELPFLTKASITKKG